MKIVGVIGTFFQKILPRFCVKYPWIIIVFFFLTTVFFSYQLPNLYIDTDINRLTTGDEAEIRAIELAAKDFQVGDPLYIILLGDMTQPGTWEKARDIVEDLQALPNVLQAISPFDATYFMLTGFNVYTIPVASSPPTTFEEVKQLKNRLELSPTHRLMLSQDDEAMLLELYIRSSYSARGKMTVNEIEKILKSKWGPGNFYLTGTSYLAHAADENIRKDVITLFPLAALIVVGVLFFSFKNSLGIVIPITTVLVSAIISIGWMAWWGYPLTIVSVVLPILLIVTSSADGIHIVNKYQEELKQTSDKKQAILITMQEMVAPCIMTSLTTAFGFLSLQTSTVIPVKDFGLFATIGVVSALLFAITGIPALLAILPPMQNKGTANKKSISFRFLDVVSGWVMEHARLVGLIGIVVFGLSALGVSHLSVEANIARYFRNNSLVSKGIRTYEDKFDGSTKVIIVVDTNRPRGTLEPEFLHTLADLETFIGTFPLVTGTSSMASIARDLSMDGQLHGELVALAHKELPSSLSSVYLSRDQQRKALIYASLKSTKTIKIAETLLEIEEGLKDLVPDVTITITGLPKIFQYHMAKFSESQIQSLIGSVSTVLFLLVLFHGSLVLGLLAMLPLIFTIGANFGLMGLVGIPLDAGTVLIGSIAIGIGIDYSIHFISRVTREQKSGKDLQTSCQLSITTAGHGIMINAITLIAGFLVLCFSIFSTLAYFGMLMALAMFVSSLASITILPVLLQSAAKIRGGINNAKSKKI